MASGVLRCTGDVTVATDGAPLCSGAWTLVTVPEPFSVDQLDPALLSGAFVAGFTLIGVCWLAGWATRTVLSLLK